MDALVDPAALAFIFLLAIFIWGARRLSWALRVLFFLTLCGFYFASIVPGADLLLRPLEDRYPPLLRAPFITSSAVVVLSGGEGWDGDRPILSGISSSSLARLAEGVRIWRLLGGEPELWVVGGQGVEAQQPPILAQAAAELGIPWEKIRWETGSRNTWEDASVVAPHLEDETFVLVTSAFHMPRAMFAFQMHGLSPTPAPCDYRASLELSPRSFIPKGAALANSAQAMREYLALLVYRWRYR